MKVLHDLQHGVCPLLVGVLLRVGPLGHEVADVLVLLVADAADAVHRLVAPVAGGDDVLARLVAVGPEEHAALHVPRRLDAGELQARRGEVDRADKLVGDRARLDVTGPADHKRDVDAPVVEPLLAADVRPAMVAEVEHDRAVGQAVVVQPLEVLADLLVQDVDRLEVERPVLPHDGMVGIVRRQRDLLRVDGVLLAVLELPVRLGELHLGEERLALLEVFPLVGVVGLDAGREVPVGLLPGGDGRQVTRVAEVLGEDVHALGQLEAVAAVAAVVVGAGGRLIRAGHEAAAAGRADRRGREGVGEHRPLAGQPVHVRRVDQRILVASELRAGVLGDDPEDVGPLAGCPGPEGAGPHRKGRPKTRRRLRQEIPSAEILCHRSSPSRA